MTGARIESLESLRSFFVVGAPLDRGAFPFRLGGGVGLAALGGGGGACCRLAEGGGGGGACFLAATAGGGGGGLAFGGAGLVPAGGPGGGGGLVIVCAVAMVFFEWSPVGAETADSTVTTVLSRSIYNRSSLAFCQTQSTITIRTATSVDCMLFALQAIHACVSDSTVDSGRSKRTNEPPL